jgi:hypothetical protein
MWRARTVLVAFLGACSSTDPLSVDAPMQQVDGTIDPGAPTASELLGLIATCANNVGGPFATDDGGTPTVAICGLTGAAFWKADLDVDCDGKQTDQCNPNTDQAYQNQTAATDSHGDPLDAASLPYVVVPSKSAAFNYETAGLDLGSVVAVIYNDRVVYGVIGDTGPTKIIGEASYAMAAALGIDPDPSTGGAESGAAYIAFTGTAAHVDPIEDHQLATTVGIARASALLGR